MISFLLIPSCSTEPVEETIYLRGALKSQILTFHPDHKDHLTHTDSKSLVKYSLKDPVWRKTLDETHFVCDVNGKQYYICQGVPGLCRNTGKCVKWERKWYQRKKRCIEREVKTLPTSQHLFLVNSGVHCWSEFTYPDGF